MSCFLVLIAIFSCQKAQEDTPVLHYEDEALNMLLQAYFPDSYNKNLKNNHFERGFFGEVRLQDLRKKGTVRFSKQFQLEIITFCICGDCFDLWHDLLQKKFYISHTETHEESLFISIVRLDLEKDEIFVNRLPITLHSDDIIAEVLQYRRQTSKAELEKFVQFLHPNAKLITQAQIKKIFQAALRTAVPCDADAKTKVAIKNFECQELSHLYAGLDEQKTNDYTLALLDNNTVIGYEVSKIGTGQLTILPTFAVRSCAYPLPKKEFVNSLHKYYKIHY